MKTERVRIKAADGSAVSFPLTQPVYEAFEDGLALIMGCTNYRWFEQFTDTDLFEVALFEEPTEILAEFDARIVDIQFNEKTSELYVRFRLLKDVDYN